MGKLTSRDEKKECGGGQSSSRRYRREDLCKPVLGRRLQHSQGKTRSVQTSLPGSRQSSMAELRNIYSRKK